MKKKLKKLNFNNFAPNSRSKSSYVSYYQQDSFDFILLTQRWSEIVGKQLEPHTSPKSLKNGVLTLLVRHSVFASQLKSLSPILIKKIVDIFPSLASQLKDIRFVASELFFEQRQSTDQAKSAKAPVKKENTYDPNYAQKKFDAGKVFDDVEDEFKELFISLYMQSDQRK